MHTFDRQAMPDQFTARNITVTVRTITRGLAYLATFIFGANAVGLSGALLSSHDQARAVFLACVWDGHLFGVASKDVHACELYDMSIELSASLLRASWLHPQRAMALCSSSWPCITAYLSQLPQDDLQRLVLEQRASAHVVRRLVCCERSMPRSSRDHQTPCVLGAALSVQLLIQPETLEGEELSNRAEDAGEDASSS